MTTTDARVAAVRRFNRAYTNLLGLLREGLLDTPYSLTEARVLFELAQRDETELGDLRALLGLDAGYMSRIIGRFERRGMLLRTRSLSDGRRQVIRLTDDGMSAFRMLDERSAAQVRAMLAIRTEDGQRHLVASMNAIEEVLGRRSRPEAVVLRPPHPGDFGWVVERHGALYADEYGWNETFEALVARIVADYLDHRDRQREAAWIAEVEGERAGCVFCMKKTEEVAQLRILLVEPAARGMGVGSRLVGECVRFARRTGYVRMTLWTNDVLESARRIYERAGFQLVKQQEHRSFGRNLVGQNWELTL